MLTKQRFKGGAARPNYSGGSTSVKPKRG